MRLAIVGCGSIGSELAEAADGMTEVKRIYLLDQRGLAAEALASKLKKAEAVRSIEGELYHCDLVIEAASQNAAREIIPKVVGRGVDIMIMSVGALVDDDYRNNVYATARNTGARILVPSGALCGTDALSSASVGNIDLVRLITTKNPESIEDVPYLKKKGIDLSGIKGPTVIYEGTAREAVKLFPKNVNVAATVSIMGVGFDRTQVTVIADPAAQANSHELIVKGDFGEIVSKSSNVPSVYNPSTSHLAALSAISALKRIIRNDWVGI
ncbi:MAG: aspartate dehydrogenase [Methanomassiliicoccaceae archaeon]|jgi:aspartate dehydrogenase|nr:aspartate dehydrogenase [Methanomassiliicoccaceae archaeon]